MRNTVLLLSLLITFIGCKKPCGDGLSGPDCSVESAPQSVDITSIEVIRFPQTDSLGSSWDITGYPDIFVKIKTSTGYVIKEGSVFDEASKGIQWAGLSINLNTNDTYTIELWDYDTFDPNDYMGSIAFKPYVNGQKFPKTLDLAPAGSPLAFSLGLYYNH